MEHPIYEIFTQKMESMMDFWHHTKSKRIQTNIDEYKFGLNDIINSELDKQIVELEKFEERVIIPKRTQLLAKLF